MAPLQYSQLSDSKLIIPAAIWIGVTGHLTLQNKIVIQRSIRSVLSELESMINIKKYKIPWTFVIISPLAEGSDRIVVEEILGWHSEGMQDPVLEVVLPLPLEDYTHDFKTESSREQFKDLLAKAGSIINLSGGPTREDAYLKAGQYVASRCDVLIAIWDGKKAHGKGGTGEIVEFARKYKRCIFWINSVTGEIKDYCPNKGKERFKSLLSYSIDRLNDYNKEEITPELFNRVIRSRCFKLADRANGAGIPLKVLWPSINSLMPNFARATILAGKYQSNYIQAGFCISILSVAIVAVVVIQVFFFKDIIQLFWLELFFVFIVISLLFISEHLRWRRKWVDYRLLAELLRSSIFTSLIKALCNDGPKKTNTTNCGIDEIPLGISSFLPEDWRNWAFSWVMLRHHKLEHEVPIKPLKAFILSSWIDDQITYYEKTSRHYRSRYNLLKKLGLIMLILTFVVAILHLIYPGYNWLHIPIISEFLTPAALILPALGSSLAGIKFYREYLLNAERYERMLERLEELREDIKDAEDLEMLALLANIAEKMMLREHLDWCETMGTREPSV